MALLSNINDKFAVDSTGAIQFNGQVGTSGYVLKSNANAAPTWVDPSTVIGGPYLPLTGGTLTGATATASGISFTVGGTLSGSTANFSGQVTAGDGTQAINTDADLTLRNGNSFVGIDLKSARTSGNIGGLRYYGTSSDTVPKAQFLVETDGQLKYYNGTNGAQTRLTINSSGNVGIGTTSPLSKLQIQANQHATNPGAKNYTGSAINADGGDIATGKLFLQGYQNTANDLCGFNNEADRVVLYNYTDARYLQLWNHTGDTFIPNGSVGIGTTSPSYKLEVQGDTYINGRDFGKPINYATAQGWVLADPTSTQTGFYGGDFTRNGNSNENRIYWDYNYAGQRALIWRTQNNDATSNDDGGWNKMMNVASNNMGYMSVVYVKKNTSSSNGTFYHGCYGGNTLYLTGTANTNPYFHNFGVGTLPQDVWCVSIGFIQANSDSNTANNPVGGVYRLDTGAKISSSSTFKMGTDSQIRQQHRVYLYYSTDVTQNLSFSDPGFYALDGSQPSISDLFGAGVPTSSSSSPFGQALKTYSGSANVTVATTVNASTVANLVSGHITITASTGASVIVKTFGIYETSNMWFKDEASPDIENGNNDIVIACSGNATNTLTFTVGDPSPVAGYGMTVSIQASPPGFFNL